MSENDEFVIQVKNVSKSYGDVQALKDVSFNVRKGEIFGLLGPNGAGKTTMLSIIECLRKQDNGSVSVMNMDVKKDSKAIQRRIGVQLQHTSLLPDLRVFEQMQLYSRLYQRKLTKDEILELINEVGLTEKVNVLPRKLSGGQKQRLTLAIALINDPEILFLDEPTVGLDVQSRHKLWDIIIDFHKRDRTVVLTTHYIEEAENLCGNVGIIDHGSLIAIGTPGELISQIKAASIITLSSKDSLEVLSTLSDNIDSQYKINTIRIETGNLVETLGKLIALIDKHKIKVDELFIRYPNLEDYFLEMTGRSLRI